MHCRIYAYTHIGINGATSPMMCNIRDDKWTKGIAVGSKGFVEPVKSALGALAKGRKVEESGDSYQLREPSAPYGEDFAVKNEDIGLKNTYFWNFNPE